MSNIEIIKQRHSVRSYTDKKIEGEVLTQLLSIINASNKESGLNIQLCRNEPKAFSGMMAKYGRLVNVNNYLAIVGKKSKDLEETCGYYGEKIVLEAQRIGLNTCWVAMTYSKSKNTAIINPGEKLAIVIAIGYGANEGVSHKMKPLDDLYSADSTSVPEWFISAVKAAQLAPTAINQQKFSFHLSGNFVKAVCGSGFYTKIDLGIAKYHFELGANNKNWQWT